MNVKFMPIGGADLFGTLYAWPDGYADAAAAVADGCYVIELLHGKGKPCEGNGSLKDLQALFNWAGWFNGLWKIAAKDPKDDKPGAVDTQHIVVAMVQTNSGYAKGEIQFLHAKVKNELRPKKRPVLGGTSWGAFGMINNVDNGTLDPQQFSDMWFMSPGGDGNIGKNFAARMKGAGCRAYFVHNVNDGVAKFKQSQILFDALKAQGSGAALIAFQNPWVNDSHASWANVLPSFAWHMYISIPPARDLPEVHKASNYAVLSGNVELSYNWYEMMRRDLRDTGDAPPDPLPEDKLVFSGHVQIFQKADGTYYTKNL